MWACCLYQYNIYTPEIHIAILKKYLISICTHEEGENIKFVIYYQISFFGDLSKKKQDKKSADRIFV